MKSTKSDSPCEAVFERISAAAVPLMATKKTVQQLHALADLFVIGEWYSYFTDLQDGQITNASKKLCLIHGVDTVPPYFDQLMDLVHPDDRRLVTAAADVCFRKILEIGFEHAPNLKSTFTFRMLTKDGKYTLFYYQNVLIPDSQQTAGFRKLHIHSTLNHMATANSYVATVMGINGRNDFHRIDLSNFRTIEVAPSSLTKREKEIVRCLADGMSSSSIANSLRISSETVRVHRKNILRKTGSHNVCELVARCTEWGVL